MTDREPENGIVALVRPFVRAIGVASLSGAIAGAVAGGIGSRVAMRVIAVSAGPLAQGQVTDNGNRVGEVTFAGSLELVIVAAVFSGLAGGLAYWAVSPSLERFGRWRGLMFGFGILLVFGSAIISFDNEDFRRFATSSLNVVLFAILFPLYGLIIAPVHAGLGRWFDSLPADGRRTLASLILTGFAVMGVLVGLGTGLAARAPGRAFVYTVVGVPLLRALLPQRWELVIFLPLVAGALFSVGEVLRVVGV